MNKKVLRKNLPEKIFNYLYNLYYLNFYKIFKKYDHQYKPEFNTAFPNIHFSNINFFSLQNELKINEDNYKKNSLITYKIRKNTYLKNNSYIFESWVAKNNITYSDNETFQEISSFLISQKKRIFESFTKKSFRHYNKKIFLLPYYTNQPGHFMGENIGSILYFLELLKNRKKKEKLLIITPSKNWDNFFKKFYKDNLLLLKSSIFIKKNIIFSKSQIFPKFSPYQNYIIAKNILSEKIENNIYKDKKFFLTSGRKERIINIKDLIFHLKKKNFLTLYPSKISIIKLFKILNSAKCLISESASISHNIHLARNKKYYLLLPKKDKFINQKWHSLTTIYNNFHSKLYKPIYCENVSYSDSKIPLQGQIKVDLKKLKIFK